MIKSSKSSQLSLETELEVLIRFVDLSSLFLWIGGALILFLGNLFSIQFSFISGFVALVFAVIAFNIVGVLRYSLYRFRSQRMRLEVCHSIVELSKRKKEE